MSKWDSLRRLVALCGALRAREPRERARRMLAALGVRLEADADRLSEPGPTGTLIVANHISWLDIVALTATEPATFLAKREISDWPVLGRAVAGAGTVFIDRDSLRALPVSVAEVAAALRRGRSVVVFPEGTTSCTGRGGTFRSAALQAALDAGAAVRPVTIDYLQAGSPSTVASFTGDDTLLASLRRVCDAGELAVRIRAHPALAPEGDRRALATAAQRVVRGGRARAETDIRWPPGVRFPQGAEDDGCRVGTSLRDHLRLPGPYRDHRQDRLLPC